ncbi:pyroglutamyl-peptidase I family protein [Bosea thiooxidans]
MNGNRKLDLLVTGFGPFPGVRVNPTTRLARLVEARLRHSGLEIGTTILETSYAVGLRALAREIDATCPKAILLLGVAARARHVRVELFARGRSNPLHPDATGRTQTGAQRGAGLPKRTTGRPQAALAQLRRLGIKSRFSPSAGRYLCDASYASALRHPAMAGRPVLFVHVPWLKPDAGVCPAARGRTFRPGTERLSQALAAIGLGLAIAGR